MQFVNVMVRRGAPLLRRPFGLSAIDSETGAIEITWAVVGLSRIMSEWTPGQTVNVLGPLGNGMDMSKLECRSNLVLIAGGTGLAPLLPLASIARKKGHKRIAILWCKICKPTHGYSLLEKQRLPGIPGY